MLIGDKLDLASSDVRLGMSALLVQGIWQSSCFLALVFLLMLKVLSVSAALLAVPPMEKLRIAHGRFVRT